jgi:hypothetical protein
MTQFFILISIGENQRINRGRDPLLQDRWPSCSSLTAIITVVVFHRTAAHFVCRVLFIIQFDFGVDGLFHVDPEFVGEAYKVDLDVGNFLFYFGEFFGWQGLALVKRGRIHLSKIVSGPFNTLLLDQILFKLPV